MPDNNSNLICGMCGGQMTTAQAEKGAEIFEVVINHVKDAYQDGHKAGVAAGVAYVLKNYLPEVDVLADSGNAGQLQAALAQLGDDRKVKVVGGERNG